MVSQVIPRFKAQPHSQASGETWGLWGSTLSPFALKVDAMCDYAGLPHRWLPAQGTRLQGLAAQRRVRRIIRGKLPLTYPKLSPLDEFPLVPFLLGPGGENLYDSTAISEWLDAHPELGSPPLLPKESRALRFVIRLVDEYLDEFGLYMVHHNRWVVAAADNRAVDRLAEDFRPMVGRPLAYLMSRSFGPRQVRRLPYLFSVAPADASFPDLPTGITPPTREGFPPTHALLEDCFRRLLAALEDVLSRQPFLFGQRFTLADASVYGQLGMNLSDASAEGWIARDARQLRAWLERIAHADFENSEPDGKLGLHAALRPLLLEIYEIFVPLMQQNRAAYRRHHDEGVRIFNERAFNRGRALYDGELRGAPFRSVAKTFQVRVWETLCGRWKGLKKSEREEVSACFDKPLDELSAAFSLTSTD